MMHSEQLDRPSTLATPRGASGFDSTPSTAPAPPRQPAAYDDDRVSRFTIPLDGLRLPSLAESESGYSLTSFRLQQRKGTTDVDDVFFR